MKLSNNIIRTLILKPYSKFSTPSTSASSSAYSKLLVSRSHGQPYSLFIPNEATIQQFRQKLVQIFPQRNIVISLSSQLLKIGQSSQKQQNYEQFKNVPLMDALMLNKLNAYEKIENGIIKLRYGISIIEYNTTNNLNIPQHIEQGINQLNKQWSQKPNATIADAISFSSIPPLHTQKNPKSQGHQNLTEEQLRSFHESLSELIRLEEFQKLQGLNLKPSSTLMTQLISIMSFQWVFLFAVTYGKYGWDVGQPMSYLSSLGVDLMAMMGIFQAEKALQEKLKNDHSVMSGIMGFPAMYKMCQWRVAYFRRKIAP